jgi:hypothetical protein
LGKLLLIKLSESDISSAINRPSIYMVHFFACSFNLLLEGFGTEVPFPLLHWQ